MSSTSSRPIPEPPASGRVEAPPTAFGSTGLVRRIVVQTLFFALPSAALFARGNALLAGRVFWLGLGLVLMRNVIAGRRDELLALVVASYPFANLLRGTVFFHIVPVMLLGALSYWYATARGGLGALSRTYPLLKWLAAYFAAYYLMTFVATRQYEINLRFTECLLGAVTVLTLGRRRPLLATAFVGFVVSAILLGLAFLPHLGDTSERLGIVDLEGLKMGNPSQLGLALALAVLALLLDRGAWTNLSTRAWLRLTLAIPPLVLLLLTTSRSAWLVVALGLVCQLVMGRRARLPALIAIGVGIIVVRVVLQSATGTGFEAGVERTFSSERSARNRTSGRSDQWIVAYNAFTESLGATVFGHGPGSGPQVYARKSQETNDVEFEVGHEMALHSMYMQIGVELGLAGLIPFAVWIAVAGRRIWEWTKSGGYVFHLAGFLGYLAVAAAVSGNDTVSGTLLGMGLLATASSHAEGRAAVARDGGQRSATRPASA